MTTTTTHVSSENIMALLDGELSASEAQAVSAHLEHCAECAAIAEEFRRTSETLSRWSVPAIPATLEKSIKDLAWNAPSGFKIAAPKTGFWNWKPWAVGSGGAATAIALMVVILVGHRSEYPRMAKHTAAYIQPPAASESRAADSQAMYYDAAPPPPKTEEMKNIVAAYTSSAPVLTPPPPSPPSAANLSVARQQHADSATTFVPMIARTITLAIMVKDVTAARSSLDALLNRYHGYSAQLTVSSQENAPRTLQGSLRIPAPALMAALGDLKTLGRVQNESQSGEEVTQQHTDLVARLQNSRETEVQLRGILQQRTGKVSDVLEVEQEIERVRGEIESMEAEQKALEHRVDFATIDIQLSEEYKAQLNAPADSISTRLHNAFVAGYHTATETLLGFLFFFEEYGPTILIWLSILTLPVFLAWRRYQKVHSRT